MAQSKKNQLRPWKTQRFCIPERDLARFIAQMELILDLYSSHHSEDEPLIAMDEASIQLLGHLYEAHRFGGSLRDRNQTWTRQKRRLSLYS